MNVGKVSVSLCWLVGNSFWHYLSDPRNQTHCFSRGRCCTHLLLNTRKLGGEANFYNWQNCGSQITLSVLRWPCYFFCVWSQDLPFQYSSSALCFELAFLFLLYVSENIISIFQEFLKMTDLPTILSILFQRSCAFVFILIHIFSLISLVLKEEWVQCAKLMIAA